MNIHQILLASYGGAGGGSDPNWTSVVTLLHFNGTNGSTTFTDTSLSAKTWTATGDAQITTTDPRFGSGALLLDGTGDWVSSASSADFAFGTGDFTIECFIKLDVTTTQYIFSFGPNWIVYFASGSLFFNINGTNIRSGAATVTTWGHLALTRSGSVVRMFWNGSQIGSDYTNAANITADTFEIGRYKSDANFRMDGRMDEFRITKGVARYTSGFTAPTAAFPDS